jgi:hypothetical protein
MNMGADIASTTFPPLPKRGTVIEFKNGFLHLEGGGGFQAHTSAQTLARTQQTLTELLPLVVAVQYIPLEYPNVDDTIEEATSTNECSSTTTTVDILSAPSYTDE